MLAPTKLRHRLTQAPALFEVFVRLSNFLCGFGLFLACFNNTIRQQLSLISLRSHKLTLSFIVIKGTSKGQTGFFPASYVQVIFVMFNNERQKYNTIIHGIWNKMKICTKY